MKNLLVMKFGGSSVGSAERMRVAARLSGEQRKKRPLVIVVSAMSGITDLLLDGTKHAEAGDPKGLAATLHKLEERHEQFSVARELVSPEIRHEMVREMLARTKPALLLRIDQRLIHEFAGERPHLR